MLYDCNQYMVDKGDIGARFYCLTHCLLEAVTLIFRHIIFKYVVAITSIVISSAIAFYVKGTGTYSW